MYKVFSETRKTSAVSRIVISRCSVIARTPLHFRSLNCKGFLYGYRIEQVPSAGLEAGHSLRVGLFTQPVLRNADSPCHAGQRKQLTHRVSLSKWEESPATVASVTMNDRKRLGGHLGDKWGFAGGQKICLG